MRQRNARSRQGRSVSRQNANLTSNLLKQVLQEDAWGIIPRTQNKRIRIIATGRYLSRTSGVLIVNRRKLSWFGRVCRHDTLPKVILPELVVAEKDRVNQRSTTSRSGEAIHYRRCCASQTIECR